MVNVVPDDVRIETYVRAATTEALQSVNEKVDRALQSGAMAVGAQARIKTTPGYLPAFYDPQFCALFGRNGVSLLGESAFADQSESGGGFSSDMGDVCHIMPALQAFAAGWEGSAHTSAYLVSDDEVAYILPAKVMAMTVIDLLWGEAAIAADIVRNHTPVLTKEEYLAFMRGMNSESVFPGV